MKPVFSAGLLLLSACIGAAYVRSWMHRLTLMVLLVCGLVAWGRASRRPSETIRAIAVMLRLVSARCGTVVMPQPQP